MCRYLRRWDSGCNKDGGVCDAWKKDIDRQMQSKLRSCRADIVSFCRDDKYKDRWPN